MLGKTRGIIRAYLPPVLWVIGGFLLAELLRWAAVGTTWYWLATLASWLSLAILLAAIARAFWVSWRLWRSHAGVPATSEKS